MRRLITLIDFDHLCKRYGDSAALRDVTAQIPSGTVTALLGPNGAGKSTSLRILLGLCEASSGAALIDGRRYRDIAWPQRSVGAVLDTAALHRGRSARAHLAAIAASSRLPRGTVMAVLGLLDLTDTADRRAGALSHGMARRVSLASALLADPFTLVLDEPFNGLDPDGVRWLRSFLRERAAQGATVLLSSHWMSEVSSLADHILVLAGGRLVADAPLDRFLAQHVEPEVEVHSDDQLGLAAGLARHGVDCRMQPDGSLLVNGATSVEVGRLALARGIAIFGLRQIGADLETAYFQSVEGKPDPAESQQ